MTDPASTATDLLVELVRADTVAAEEGALARRCAGLLADAGLTGSLLDFEPGREQYVGRVGGDSPLTFTGHLDTVPATPSDWTVDPWAAEPDGDRLVGRGTEDEVERHRRLATAREELAAQTEFDVSIVNREVHAAAEELVALMELGPDE